MVRGLAALLALGLAQAYFLIPDALPRITPEDTSLLIAGGAGLLLIALCAALVTALSDEPFLLWLVVLGGGIVVAALNAADAGAAATPAEAVAFSAVGAAFACSLLTPSLAVALPLFVACVDAASTLLGGPSQLLAEAGRTQPGDPLSLEVPDWGNGIPAGRLGIADAVFVGVFLVYARRFGLRPVATACGLAVALVAALVLKLELDAAVPALPLMAAAYFLVNADRLPALFRRAAGG